MADRAAPILPSRDYDVTASFYHQLGFEEIARYDPPDGPWLIMGRGPIWLHFFRHEHDPYASNWMLYLHLDDPDAWADEFRSLGLPSEHIPRFGDIEDKPWGMREFVIVDPDGTLIRAGRGVSEPPNG